MQVQCELPWSEQTHTHTYTVCSWSHSTRLGCLAKRKSERVRAMQLLLNYRWNALQSFHCVFFALSLCFEISFMVSVFYCTIVFRLLSLFTVYCFIGLLFSLFLLLVTFSDLLRNIIDVYLHFSVSISMSFQVSNTKLATLLSHGYLKQKLGGILLNRYTSDLLHYLDYTCE